MTPSGVSNQGNTTLATLLPTKPLAGTPSSAALTPVTLPKGLSRDAVQVQISEQGRAAAAAARQTPKPTPPEATTLVAPPQARTIPGVANQVTGGAIASASNDKKRNLPSLTTTPRVVTPAPEKGRPVAEPAPAVTRPSNGAPENKTPAKETVSLAPAANASQSGSLAPTTPPPSAQPPSANELAQTAVNATQKFVTIQGDTMRKSVQGSIFSAIA